MDDKILSEDSIPESVVHLLLTVSNSSALDKALECLIEIAKTANGRSELASQNIVSAVLQLFQSLSYPSCRHLILLSLKLVRNLCAGEISNQNSFLEENGVGIISSVISLVRVASSSSDYEIIRMGLQLLGNVSLAGGEHQHAVWHQFFPLEFHEIAQLRSRETCDPLCMVIFTCCEGTNGLLGELCSDQGMDIVISILRTASAAALKEDWLKFLLSRICLEGSYFSLIFSKFYSLGVVENCHNIMPSVDSFAEEQAFLLRTLSDILNEQINDLIVSSEFALSVLKILRSAIGVIDTSTRCKSGLPTGSAAIDVLGYSLTILRDICACDGLTGFKEDGLVDIVDMLVSDGLIDLLLGLLRDLEPPAIIRKAMRQADTEDGTTSQSSKTCTYKGFRRDIVSILGNCAYKRKRVQDEIREKNGILILLQQCVTDEDNPFLREWGIWAVRNLLEGNAENQRLVSDMELQGSVDVPEIAELGLRVEVDPKTRRAKLVNAS